MKTRSWTRVLSTLLTVAMIATLLVVPAGAATAEQKTVYTVEFSDQTVGDLSTSYKGGTKQVNGGAAENCTYFAVNPGKIANAPSGAKFEKEASENTAYSPSKGYMQTASASASKLKSNSLGIIFETKTANAKLKVWWQRNGCKKGVSHYAYDAKGEAYDGGTKLENEPASSATAGYINEVTLKTAGKYAVAAYGDASKVYICKIEVTETIPATYDITSAVTGDTNATVTFQDADGKAITEAAAGTVVTVVAAGTGKYVPKTYATDDSATTVAADENGKQVFTMPAKNIKVTVDFEQQSSDALFTAAREKLTADVLNYTVAQADVNTETAAKTDVETKLATALTGTGVTAVVTTTGAFKAATGAADKDSTEDDNGSYTYSVVLKVGEEAEGSGAAAITGTVTIEATTKPYTKADVDTAISAAKDEIKKAGAGAKEDVFSGKKVVSVDAMNAIMAALDAAQNVSNTNTSTADDFKTQTKALAVATTTFAAIVEAATETGTKTGNEGYVLNVDDLFTAAGGGTASNAPWTWDSGNSRYNASASTAYKAGKNDYFTISPRSGSSSSRLQAADAFFADGFEGGHRLYLATSGENGKVSFTVTAGATATVKVWWVSNNKTMALSGTGVGTPDGPTSGVTKNMPAITTWSGLQGGQTYTLSDNGGQYIFRVEVKETGPAAGAAPVFAENGGATYQVTKADAAAGTVSFTLKDAPTGAIYKLYAVESGVYKQINVSTPGVTADANKKITFTLDDDHKGLLTGASAGTTVYYVSSTETDKGESDKTEVSVKLYVPVTGVTLKHMNEDGKTVSHVLYEKMKASDPDVIGSAENESAKYPNGWKLVAVVAPEDATDKRVVFSNARVTPEFIEVAEDGTVTATKAGTGRIRVASVDDPEKFIAAEITVKVRIGAVEIQNADGTAAATTVAMGKTLPLKAVVTASANASQSHQEVEWKTSDATVATVSAAGVVTPVKPGQVKITATSKQDDTVKDELTLTVSKGTPALTFTTGNPQVTSGGKVRFKLEGVPAGVTPTFTVKQGDTAAAVTVYELDNDTDYNYYADMPENDTGATVTYTVTAKVDGNDSWNAAEKSVEVKVLDVNAKNIYIVSPGAAKDVELAQGGDAKLEVIAQVNKAGGVKDDAATAALTYKWTKDGEAMSDATYAITVDTAGVYVCTVTSADEKVETKEVTVTFTVTQAAVTLTAIDVTPATGVDYTAATGALKITGPVDATFTVTTTPAEGHGDTLVAVSSTPSVARVTLVDGKLTVTPWSAGETTVTIRGTAAAEVKKEIKVTVVKAAAPAALTADDYTVTQPTVAGGKGTIKITQNAPEGTEYVYRKGDSGAWIKFPANKTIEVEPGTYKIRVYVPKPELQETTNGVAVEIKEFTAAPTVAGVVVTSTADSLQEGKTLQLTAQVHMSNNTVSATETVTWTTSDATVATVSATGLVTGVKAGTVTVTATSTTDNTKKGSKTLTVTAKSGGGDEPTPADKTALNKAIADATRLAKDTYTVADDTKVSQVNKGTQFVTEADQAKLAAAIADAKAVAAKADATEQEVADAEKALADAVTAFKAAVKTGTKSTNSGGSRPSANNGITTNKTTNNPAGGKTTVKKDSAGNVTITATDDKGEVIAEVKLPAHIPSVGYKFVDVPEGHWAETAINDMAGLELVKGVDETQHLFDMTSPITRGAVATILSRLANGKADVKDIFSDVAEGQWFAEGVAWAAKAGVVTGFEDGTFGPDGSITREQLAVMIARYAKLLGLDVTAAAGELADFADAESIQSWAVEGMAWCVKTGIIQGRGNGVVDPSANATRAEATVMLGRLVDLLK